MSSSPTEQSNRVITDEISVALTGTNINSGDLKGFTLAGIYHPASLASTAGTVYFSTDGTTYYQVKDEAGTAMTLTFGSTAAYIPVCPAVFMGARYVRIVMGSSETAKTFILAVRPI
jgi:hypothetical protein